MSRPDPIVVTLVNSGPGVARQVATLLDADLHGPEDFDSPLDHVRQLFAAGIPIVGVCAAGILIRALAPVLDDKRTEPPVLAVAEDGSSVVPLLGGHHGANALARGIAKALGGHAAITTAGDLALHVALDEPPPGWILTNPLEAKTVAAALLRGGSGTLSGQADWLGDLPQTVSRRPAPDADAPVVLSAGDAALVYHRQTLALGVGCARGCPPGELIGLVGRTLAAHGVSQAGIASVHSLDLKADEAAVHALADHLDVPATFFDAAALEAEAERLANPSNLVFEEVGCHGVAEGAALAASGPDGRLLIEKTKSANATCALARIGTMPRTGRARGHLAVVGIGPGKADWRTPEATRLIATADELVGYDLYLDLLGPLGRRTPRKSFPLGQEEARCRYALERASEGRRVALISSGDAGIFAMGALVAELLDRPEAEGGVSAAARRVAVTNVPGISALQAASARAGALLGHDFCAISLSDLLTPRDQILTRLTAAAEGDFVIALYNPVSKRRRTLLAEARRILLEHRPAETPVLLASNLGRPQEQLKRRALNDLEVDEVDMLTIVLIGARQSRAFATGDASAGAEGHLMYTPRGYAAKRTQPSSPAALRAGQSSEAS